MTSNVIKLSVIVPCYNEESSIPLLVKKFYECKPKDLNCELILVDNGSTDRTRDAIIEAAKVYNFVKLSIVENNIGYGYGILSGLKSAKGEFLSWTHADLQTDPIDTIKAYRSILEQKDPKRTFIRGSRIGRSLFDRFFTVGMAVFETLLLREWLWEINAQPKLFHRNLFELAKNPPHDWSFDLYYYYMAKKNNFEIKSIKVIFFKRIHGVSHWNTGFLSKIKFIKRTLDYSFQLKNNLK